MQHQSNCTFAALWWWGYVSVMGCITAFDYKLVVEV